MNKYFKIGIITAVAVMAGVVLAVKQANHLSATNTTNSPTACCSLTPNLAVLSLQNHAGTNPVSTAAPAEKKSLPELVDLGASKCVPCKMMAPILEELRKEYDGRLEVTFIDVWQNPDAGKAYRVEMIPTQIFLDANGQELFRHTGFFAKADILAKWQELGVDLTGKSSPATATNSVTHKP
jgi:thioredoxin 1